MALTKTPEELHPSVFIDSVAAVCDEVSELAREASPPGERNAHRNTVSALDMLSRYLRDVSEHQQSAITDVAALKQELVGPNGLMQRKFEAVVVPLAAEALRIALNAPLRALYVANGMRSAFTPTESQLARLNVLGVEYRGHRDPAEVLIGLAHLAITDREDAAQAAHEAMDAERERTAEEIAELHAELARLTRREIEAAGLEAANAQLQAELVDVREQLVHDHAISEFLRSLAFADDDEPASFAPKRNTSREYVAEFISRRADSFYVYGPMEGRKNGKGHHRVGTSDEAYLLRAELHPDVAFSDEPQPVEAPA